MIGTRSLLRLTSKSSTPSNLVRECCLCFSSSVIDVTRSTTSHHRPTPATSSTVVDPLATGRLPTSYANSSTNDNISISEKPRASNPKHFQRINPQPPRSTRRPPPPQGPERRSARSTNPPTPPAPPRRRRVAEWLDDQSLPTSSWIRVDNVPPTSSLDAITRALQSTLQRNGILNLDAAWNPNSRDDKDKVPMLLVHGDYVWEHENGGVEEPQGNDSGVQWMTQARVILSPFARPTGWRIQLANRSLVHAILSAAEASPVLCSSRPVRVQEWHPDKDPQHRKPSRRQPLGACDEDSAHVSDCTLRVENCSGSTSKLKLLNLFARYDLISHSNPHPALSSENPGSPQSCIERWDGTTVDGKAPPPTWLVHFADAASARAALRDIQGVQVDGRKLLLVQYPQQKTLPQ